VTAVTGTFTQFCAVVVGLKATSPATVSPAPSAGLLLDVTFPVIAWLAVTPFVVTDAVVEVPLLQWMVAVSTRLPLAQLAFADTGLGDVLTDPVVTVVFGAAALPERQPLRKTPLSVIDCCFAVCVSPGLMVAEPFS
jgi:hypothetical protein